jgi:hypothetical protein
LKTGADYVIIICNKNCADAQAGHQFFLAKIGDKLYKWNTDKDGKKQI